MTTFNCQACGEFWSEGPTRNHRLDQTCRKCLGRQNSMLVEALEQVKSYSNGCVRYYFPDSKDCTDLHANKADRCYYCIANAALAAVKEADKSAKEK